MRVQGWGNPGPITTMHLLHHFVDPGDDRFTLPNLILTLFSDVDPGVIVVRAISQMSQTQNAWFLVRILTLIFEKTYSLLRIMFL